MCLGGKDSEIAGHADHRLARSFFGVSVKVPPTMLTVANSLVEELVEDGEEVLA
jgi:hypothetical protein